jgi:hypothetical protein
MIRTILILLGLSFMAVWSPQPGPQALAAVCPADFPLFGGSRGGGKSDCLLGRHVHGAKKYGRFWNGLIVRRKYKDFLELRRRIDELIIDGLEAERIGGDQQTNYVRFKNGAQVSMPAISRLEMVNDFVGHQYCEISIDEVTTFPFFSRMVDKLKGSNRSPHGVHHAICLERAILGGLGIQTSRNISNLEVLLPLNLARCGPMKVGRRGFLFHPSSMITASCVKLIRNTSIA